MTRSRHAQRHWRRKVLGVGLTASLLLVGPTAVWADGADDDAVSEESVEEADDPGADETRVEGPAAEVPSPAPIEEEPIEKSGEAGDSQEEDSELEAPASEKPELKTTANGTGTPYLEWTVTDSSGNNVGGASFTLRGPALRTSGFLSGHFSWGVSYTVEDCTSADCSGFLDKDPAPGKFKVPSLTALIEIPHLCSLKFPTLGRSAA